MSSPAPPPEQQQERLSDAPFQHEAPAEQRQQHVDSNAAHPTEFYGAPGFAAPGSEMAQYDAASTDPAPVLVDATTTYAQPGLAEAEVEATVVMTDADTEPNPVVVNGQAHPSQSLKQPFPGGKRALPIRKRPKLSHEEGGDDDDEFLIGAGGITDVTHATPMPAAESMPAPARVEMAPAPASHEQQHQAPHESHDPMQDPHQLQVHHHQQHSQQQQYQAQPVQQQQQHQPQQHHQPQMTQHVPEQQQQPQQQLLPPPQQQQQQHQPSLQTQQQQQPPQVDHQSQPQQQMYQQQQVTAFEQEEAQQVHHQQQIQQQQYPDHHQPQQQQQQHMQIQTQQNQQHPQQQPTDQLVAKGEDTVPAAFVGMPMAAQQSQHYQQVPAQHQQQQVHQPQMQQHHVQQIQQQVQQQVQAHDPNAPSMVMYAMKHEAQPQLQDPNGFSAPIAPALTPAEEDMLISKIPAQHRGPSQDEMKAAKTPRARNALHSWYRRLKELYAFRERHGHVKVPQKFKENPALGVWVNKQRSKLRAYENGDEDSMSQEKIDALTDVGFEWGKRYGQIAWNSKYNELKAFKERHGHSNVKTKNPENPALGRWVSTQRSQHKKYQAGQKSKLTEERVRKLNELEFVWSMTEPKGGDDKEIGPGGLMILAPSPGVPLPAMGGNGMGAPVMMQHGVATPSAGAMGMNGGMMMPGGVVPMTTIPAPAPVTDVNSGVGIVATDQQMHMQMLADTVPGPSLEPIANAATTATGDDAPAPAPVPENAVAEVTTAGAAAAAATAANAAANGNASANGGKPVEADMDDVAAQVMQGLKGADVSDLTETAV